VFHHVAPEEVIDRRISIVRGRKVMLDVDLAGLPYAAAVGSVVFPLLSPSWA
jgi:hypothetical protein